MNNNIKQIENNFLSFVKKIIAYNEAVAIMYWDLRTGAPKKGVEQRSEVIGILSSEIFQMQTSEEMKTYLTALLKEEVKTNLSEVTWKTALECQETYDRMKKIPLAEYQEFVTLQTKAETIWEEAKEKANFAMFQPYLEQLVSMTKKFIDYWGYKDNKYDTLLHMYEPGLTVETLDRVFLDVRTKLVPLLQKIQESPNKPNTDFLYTNFPKEQQKFFSMEILKQMGYDFAAGRLDETVHPFAIGINPGDVRVTTKYDENDFRVAIFGTIHEGGHALYEQNISKELVGTPLASGASMGIHESQSLFNEIFVGRSRAFWEYNYELFKKYAGAQFDSVPVEEFYRAINEVKRSLIRIEADELTYPLHIMIRYEIEKALFNDEIEVKDLPEIWNKKYEEYLGITPDNDGVGVLQDVHWAGGSFGYFPSYALGYMYAAQFKNALLKDIPNFTELLKTGELLEVKNWFTEKVHQFGKLKKPLEILRDATGESLNANYLINYLTEKYTEIYNL
ncbi:carboxypeptidase M32 [Bacillus kwashiorkori]|uniref:carboxypeptidase M32 n=1 Tax=Bacillus kwashiorkori TaxID=1522318 RepID=UPI000783ABCD|nr:carboxypeptidase M32 [Bacillus kwashiorkori]